MVRRKLGTKWRDQGQTLQGTETVVRTDQHQYGFPCLESVLHVDTVGLPRIPPKWIAGTIQARL
jgi:hypothetical protein